MPTEVDDSVEHAAHHRDSSAHLKRRTHYWLRWAHTYIGMASLLIVLFFGVTGLTLNHPSWTFGDETSIETFSGVLPADAIAGDQTELLLVSEFVRSEYGVSADVADFQLANGSGSISYKSPGYGASLLFDSDTGEYSLTVQQEGFVAVMNDMHKGRDASTLWRWIIDLSAGLLVVISLTGLGIQLFLKKRRSRALGLSAAGAVAAVVLIWMTVS